LIKSPYVADIIGECFDDNPFAKVNADVELSKTQKKKEVDEIGTKLKDTHVTYLAHAPSLDCAGMVVSGTNVYVSKNTGTGKTDYTIQLAAEERGEGAVIVGYHPSLAEKAAKEMLSLNLLQRELGEYEELDIGSQKSE